MRAAGIRAAVRGVVGLAAWLGAAPAGATSPPEATKATRASSEDDDDGDAADASEDPWAAPEPEDPWAATPDDDAPSPAPGVEGTRRSETSTQDRERARGTPDFDPAEVLAAWDAELSARQDLDTSVLGRPLRLRHRGGAGRDATEVDLARFEDDDLGRWLLRTTPGVYVRTQDGFGLDPPVGMRGTSSAGRRGVVTLEGGVLSAPAPFSDPGATYFPLLTRLDGLRVRRGGSAVVHGAGALGGSLDARAPSVPGRGHHGRIDLALGTERYGKGHARYGYGTERWGVRVEGVRLRSDGFSRRDPDVSSEDDAGAGFDRVELVAEARVNSDPARALRHRGELELGVSRQRDREPRSGLSGADAVAAPNQRYLFSARDRGGFDRLQVRARYRLVWQDRLEMRTVVYRHDTLNTDRRGTGFMGSSPSLAAILDDPTGDRAGPFEVLTGRRDSAVEGLPPLSIADDERRYVAQGLQSDQTWTLPPAGPVRQRLHSGVRFHSDRAWRRRRNDAFAVAGGRLSAVEGAVGAEQQDRGRARAWALYLEDEVTWGRLTATPGMRVTLVTQAYARRGGPAVDDRDTLVNAGLGLTFEVFDGLDALAGVHRATRAATLGPSAADLPSPTSVAFEGGGRLATDLLRWEAIGFMSRQDGVSAPCFVTTRCEGLAERDDRVGAVRVAGVEARLAADVPTPIDLEFPVALAYTFTDAEVTDGFVAPLPGFRGAVDAGDPVPYVPEHQLGARAGIRAAAWGSFDVAATYVSPMSAPAGSPPLGGGADATRTEAQFAIDIFARARVLPELAVYGNVFNLFDNRPVVARGPDGVRAARPRFGSIGVEVTLDD
ncbi:MAG: TonB-dependent receptor [Myxococcota bacterium]